MDSGPSARRGRRRTVFLLGALALAFVTSPWWLGGARDAMRRAMLMTTADPDALGLVATASMEPITVTLHTRRPETVLVSGPMGERTDRTGRTIDQKLVFRAPAAYFNVLDLKEGPAGPQRVGFSVWSGKFDPAQPDLLKALRETNGRPVDPDHPTAFELRKRETGEYVLDFEVSNYHERESEQQRVLNSIVKADQAYPCDRRFDESLQMMAVTVPDGVKPRESCLRTAFANAAIYFKQNQDGTIRFVAKCGGSGPKGHPLHERCALSGFFRSWPLHVWAPAQHIATWNESFDRIQKFLTSIVVENG